MPEHEMMRGDSKEITFTIVDGDGERLDLSGLTLAFTAKRELSDAQEDAIIAKTTGDGIEHLTQSGATLGQAVVTIDPADTSSLPAYSVGLYYDLEVQDDDDRYTTESGLLAVFADVTTAPTP